MTSVKKDESEEEHSAASLCRFTSFHTTAKYITLDEAVKVVHNNMYNMIKEDLYPTKKRATGSDFSGFQFDLDFPESDEFSDSEADRKEKEDDLKHVKEEGSLKDIKSKIQERLHESGLIIPEKSIPGLKEFCRWEIRHVLGLNVIELAGKLPLPSKLRDYLLMPELSQEPAYKDLFQRGCYYGCLFGCMHGVSIKDLLK